MRDYLETLRAKPENTRKMIALGTAGAFTGAVTLAWIIALVSTGALTIAPSEVSNESEPVVAETQRRYSDLAGAASAFYGQSSGDASITVVEEERSSTLDRTEATPTDATVIHF